MTRKYLVKVCDCKAQKTKIFNLDITIKIAKITKPTEAQFKKKQLSF